MRAEELITSLSSIFETKKELELRLSKVDTAISDIYHELEVASLNVVQAYKVIKHLQTLLKERREVKEELAPITSLCSSFEGSNISSKVAQAVSKAKTVIENRPKIGGRGGLNHIIGKKPKEGANV